MTELIHDPLFGDIAKVATYWEVDVPAGAKRTLHFALDAEFPRRPIVGLLEYARRVYGEIRVSDEPFHQFIVDELLETVNEDRYGMFGDDEPLDEGAFLASLFPPKVYIQYDPNGSPYARLVYAADFLSGEWIVIQLDSELNKIGVHIE